MGVTGETGMGEGTADLVLVELLMEICTKLEREFHKVVEVLDTRRGLRRNRGDLPPETRPTPPLFLLPLPPFCPCAGAEGAGRASICGPLATASCF